MPFSVRTLGFALAVSLVIVACGSTIRQGPGGIPPLAPQDAWARQRVEAVLSVYTFSPPAVDAVRRLRVQHVVGRPGWFGSTGYDNWLGVGQARITSIVHEMSHSLWGPFPVGGRPELSWRVQPGERVSPGLQAQRRDLDVFVQQPPDALEPLRARLRLIPDLITGDFPGLYHLGEAEVIHFTAGNVDLVPPILRKYYGPLLAPGQFQSWDEAIAWYLRLPAGQRRIADAYFGINELPLGSFAVAPGPPTRVDPRIAAVVDQEEQQRLIDFVEQFDLYFRALDDGGPVANDPAFWRGYVRDVVQVFRAHPDLPATLGEGGRRTGGALQLIADIESLPREQRPAAARRRLVADPFLLNVVAALDNATLAALIAGDGTDAGAQGARLVRGALRPLHLRLLDLANRLRSVAPLSPVEAGQTFDRFLKGLDQRDREKMNFILDVLGETDREATRTAMNNLSPEGARLLVDKAPAFTRFLLQPEELVGVLGFGGDLAPERLAELAQLFNDKVSATPHIDLPFLQAVYRRVVGLGRSEPQRAIQLFADTGLLIEPFIVNDPAEAVALFGKDVPLAAQVFETANPVRLPPARAIYLLVRADPEFAARVTLRYEEAGRPDVVNDAVAFFAYDLPRSQSQPGLGISLEKDAQYLQALAQIKGESWMEQALSRARRTFEERIQAGSMDPAFLEVYRKTLDASLATVAGTAARQRLETLVSRALG